MHTTSTLFYEYKPLVFLYLFAKLKRFKALINAPAPSLLSLEEMKPVARSSLLALGYEAAECEFILETLAHDLRASYPNHLLIIQ